jgi:hypothetical protein
LSGLVNTFLRDIFHRPKLRNPEKFGHTYFREKEGVERKYKEGFGSSQLGSEEVGKFANQRFLVRQIRINHPLSPSPPKVFPGPPFNFRARINCRMCIVFISFQYHEGYKLIVLANRDEYVTRPTAPARWWQEGLLGGTGLPLSQPQAQDLLREGTQFAVTESGKFGVLTNFREPGDGYSATSRGHLIRDFLM